MSSKLEEAIRYLVEHDSQLGFTIIKALIVFLVGRLVINLLNKLVRKILSKRDIDPSVKTFVGSLVNVSLTILLIISVVGALGVQTTSFAALLASAKAVKAINGAAGSDKMRESFANTDSITCFTFS